MTPLTIGVDFDGTIVTHRYPAIGTERPGAIDALLKLTADGHRLILWTVREGELLEEAVQWCRERGVEFYAVNKDYPEEQSSDSYYSRKLKVDVWIDDRNIGGLPSWEEIYHKISTGKPLEYTPSTRIGVLYATHSQHMQRYQRSAKKRGWLARLLGR